MRDASSSRKRGEVVRSPQFRVQLMKIADVVSMRTPWRSLKQRRSVNVADAQIVKVRNQKARLGQCAIPIELEPITCAAASYPRPGASVAESRRHRTKWG
jgi:hypothetical protein